MSFPTIFGQRRQNAAITLCVIALSRDKLNIIAEASENCGNGCQMFTFFNVVTVGSSVALKSLCPVRNRSNRKEKWTHWYFNLPEKRETVLRPLKKLHRCCQNHPFSLRYVDHKNVFSHKSTSEFLCFPCFSPDPVIFLKRLHVLISAEIWLHPSFFYQKEQKKGCLLQWVEIAWNKIKVVFLFSKWMDASMQGTVSSDEWLFLACISLFWRHLHGTNQKKL